MGMAGEVRSRDLELVRSEALSPSVRALTLRTIDGSPLEWNPGQHLTLMRPDLERPIPYSIASAPDVTRPGHLEVAVGLGGTVPVAFLEALPLGSRFTMTGPSGSFTREALREDPAVLVGTGTGVAPLRAMIHAELSRRSEGPALVLLAGHRAESDVLWGKEFEALERAHPRFRFAPTLSNPGTGWRGRVGYVQDHVRDVLVPLGHVPVFVCGNPKMIAETEALLVSGGHPRHLVLRERYG